MTRTKTLFLALAAAAALGSLAFAVDSTTSPSTPVDAPAPEARGRMERLTKFAVHRLDLSETQVTALKEVFRLHQPELQPLMERSRAEREELRAIVSAPTLDEAALEAQATKIAETTKALTIASAHMRADMRTVLTPEQVEKLMHARRHIAERSRDHRKAFSAWLEAP